MSLGVMIESTLFSSAILKYYENCQIRDRAQGLELDSIQQLTISQILSNGAEYGGHAQRHRLVQFLDERELTGVKGAAMFVLFACDIYTWKQGFGVLVFIRQHPASALTDHAANRIKHDTLYLSFSFQNPNMKRFLQLVG